jgi:hypothetical protein
MATGNCVSRPEASIKIYFYIFCGDVGSHAGESGKRIEKICEPKGTEWERRAECGGCWEL